MNLVKMRETPKSYLLVQFSSLSVLEFTRDLQPLRARCFLRGFKTNFRARIFTFLERFSSVSEFSKFARSRKASLALYLSV